LDGGCANVFPVKSEKSADNKKQHFQPQKRVSGMNFPAHCRETQRIKSAYDITNYNSDNVQQRFLPFSLQQRICKKIRDYPKVILQNFSKMCSLTSSTFCICTVLFKPE